MNLYQIQIANLERKEDSLSKLKEKIRDEIEKLDDRIKIIAQRGSHYRIPYLNKQIEQKRDEIEKHDDRIKSIRERKQRIKERESYSVE